MDQSFTVSFSLGWGNDSDIFQFANSVSFVGYDANGL